MSFLPITLGVRPAPGAGKVSPAKTKAMKEEALQRDGNTCRFCGFHALKYQRVIACADAGDPPYATVCTFCEQCLMPETTGITGAGLLVWLPELTQVQLNHIVRAIYVARSLREDEGGEALANMATRALDMITSRRADAKRRLGSDDPILLATIMQENLSPEEKQTALTKLEGVRLLPAEKYMVHGPKGDANHFPQIVRFWSSPQGPFGRVPANQWQEMFQTAASTAGNA